MPLASLFARFRRSQSKIQNRKSKIHRRRAFFEPLEHRLVLTGITTSLNGDALHVFGTTSADTIVIDQLGSAGAEVRVLDNGIPAFTYASSAVASVTVAAGDGNDTVTIDPSFGTRPAHLYGYEGNDTLIGGPGDDYIDGVDGDDILIGNGGNDSIIGSNPLLPINASGSDQLDGGSGNDILHANAGELTATSPRVVGGPGYDSLSFRPETLDITFNNNNMPVTGEFEVISGGYGNDTITNSGSSSPVQIIGYEGNDTLTGGEGNDYLDGVDGDDTLAGNGGDDTLVGYNPSAPGNSGADKLDGGSGNDTIIPDAADLTAAPSALKILGGEGAADILDLRALPSDVTFNNDFNPAAITGGFEQIFGGNGNDTITTTGPAPALYYVGYAGNDTLQGGPANDYLYGADGNDTLAGLAGADNFLGGAGNDTLDYSASPTAVQVDLSTGTGVGGDAQGDTYDRSLAESLLENITGSAFNDTLTGNHLANVIGGRAGDDYLFGGDGYDVLTGGLGSDKFEGGAGDDTINADAADSNTASPVIRGDSGADLLDFPSETVGITLFNNAGSSTGGFELIFGGAGNDTFTNSGSTAAVEFYGGSGNDILTGGDGDDLLIGEDGEDALAGNEGSDDLSGGDGDDDLTGGPDADSLEGDGGADDLDGGSGDDDLEGGEGNDQMDGGPGADSLYGGTGDDQLTGSQGEDSFDGGGGNDDIEDSQMPSSISLTIETPGDGNEGTGFIVVGYVSPPRQYSLTGSVTAQYSEGFPVLTDGNGRFEVSSMFIDDGPSPGNGSSADPYTITVNVAVEGYPSLTASDSADVTIHNIDPVLQVWWENYEVHGIVDEQHPAVATPDVQTITIDWGDGSANTIITGVMPGFEFTSGGHEFPNPEQQYKVRITSTDDDTGYDTKYLTTQPLTIPEITDLKVAYLDGDQWIGIGDSDPLWDSDILKWDVQYIPEAFPEVTWIEVMAMPWYQWVAQGQQYNPSDPLAGWTTFAEAAPGFPLMGNPGGGEVWAVTAMLELSNPLVPFVLMQNPKNKVDLVIDRIAWEGINVDGSTNLVGTPDTSFRFYPEKNRFDGAKETTHEEVNFNVFIRPPLLNQTVYIRAIDADDPSSSTDPVDDDGPGGDATDNRSTDYNLDKLTAIKTTAIAGPVAVAKEKLKPANAIGDNYRMIATGRNTTNLSRVRARFNQPVTGEPATEGAGRLMFLGPSANSSFIMPTGPRDIGGNVVHVSPLLTIWRSLWVEVDAMPNHPLRGRKTTICCRQCPRPISPPSPAP